MFLLISPKHSKIPTKYDEPKKSLINSKPLIYLNHLFQLVFLKLISNQIFSKKQYNNI